MLSQIVFIAFLLAVCIRNSENVSTYTCTTDQKVVTTLKNLPNKIFPILLIKGYNPVNDSNELKAFINTYNEFIVVDNSNDGCPCSDAVLQNALKEKKKHPILFMVNDGQMVKPQRTTLFSDDKPRTRITLNNLRTAALQYKQKTKGTLSLHDEILNNIFLSQVLGGTPVGYVAENPTGILPRPESPYIMTSMRSHDQGQSSGQPNSQTNISMTAAMEEAMMNYQNFQMIRPNPNQVPLPSQPYMPIAQYPMRPTRPKELNLLGSMENKQGRENNFSDSPQTFSQSSGWINLNKRLREDEGPSGGSRSRTRSRSRSRS